MDGSARSMMLSFGWWETSMNLAAISLRLWTAVLLISPTTHAQSQPSEEPNFQIEIQAAADAGPKFMVTNLTGRAVTARVIRISSSAVKKEQARQVWDALLQNELPIRPNAGKSAFLSRIVGTLLPDKVEAIAGVWADGETFGQPDWVKVILTNREAEASANEQAAALLQEGLDQNWSREQYLKAAGETRNSGPIAVLRCALLANPNADKPRHLIQNLWDTFTGESVQIRTAKPPLTAASSSKSSQATVRAYSSSIFKQFRPAGVPPSPTVTLPF
jgi:hypothetical protein